MSPSSDNQLRKYGYQYDELNRLRNSIYQRPGTTNVVTNMYNESMSYDKNGNIQTLQRNGDFDGMVSSTPAIQIDNLIYTYNSTSPNQLLAVNESLATANSVSGFVDGNTIGNDYSYDANGNMISDLNKKTLVSGTNKPSLTKITYNHLNLPTEIFFAPTRKMNYIYNALGVKVQKIRNSGLFTDYLGGFQYERTGTAAAKLLFFPTAEGYVSHDAGIYKYMYNYTDHLGNVRLSYCKEPTLPNGIAVLEENHYYPFGLKHNNYNVTVLGQKGVVVGSVMQNNYKYKFSGKEYQDELGLNFYDFGARNYDAAIGRWMNIDPLAETSRRISPYVYALNNPVYFIDPDGMDEDGWGSRDYEGTDFYDPGWIENKTNHGIHHEPEIRSQQDLIDRGRGDEKFICNEGEYTRHDGHVWQLFDRVGPDNYEWVRENNNTTSDSGTIIDEIVNNEGENDVNLDVKFEINSTEIDFEHNGQDLNDLLKTMQEHKDIKINILGNVSYDNTVHNVNDIVNINDTEGTIGELQLFRANAVVNFLINNGISKKRLKSGNGKIEPGSRSVSIKVIK